MTDTGTNQPGEGSDGATPVYGLRSGATWRDPYPMYAALRTHDPVHRVARGDYWVLTRFADVFAAARDHDRFSSADGLTVTYGERERIGLDVAAPLVMLDPPDHTAFRRLVARAMTPRRVAPLASTIRAFIVERLDRWPELDAVDLVADLAKPLANMVVAHFLGVPESDRSHFATWTEAIVEANADGDPLAAGASLAELLGYFDDLINRRRQQPGDDLLSLLLADRDDGTVVPLEQILGFAFTMVAGGNDTVMGMIAGSAVLLAAHPDQRAVLAAMPTLDPAPIEELFRLVCPVQGLARTTTEDVTIDEVTIPVGRKVLLVYASANRDHREFGGDADTLRLDRDVRRMLTFGSGAHHCLGAAAARLEVRLALEELLARYPEFEVDEEQAVFADGNYVRRYARLPFRPGRRRA